MNQEQLNMLHAHGIKKLIGNSTPDLDRIINLIVRDVAELPDRTSPEDWPEAMLVTDHELRGILRERLQ